LTDVEFSGQCAATQRVPILTILIRADLW